ncbi:MAG: hypothetical protein ACFFE5_13125, partial [Candidatus Thorarchaeota archaeon]
NKISLYLNRKNKAYLVCKKSISFSEFISDNPSISELRAIKLWNNSIVGIFCPDCYFNLKKEKECKFIKSYILQDKGKLKKKY